MRLVKFLIVVALVIYVVRAPQQAADTLRAAAGTAYALAVVVFDGVSAFISGLSR